VKPWVELARAPAPGGGTLILRRRDREHVILVDGELLMSSRQHGSEEALARIGCARLGRAPRVLVGGLGMGFTLRAALDLLPADGEVTVAELVPAVVDWNRGPLADLAGRPLDDPRARVHVGDVAEVIGAARGLDAILLDVDNSPHALTRPSNQGLYGEAGLAAAARALRPGGCLAIWSAVQAPEVAGRMRRAGLAPEAHAARAVGRSGGVHTIYVGRTDGSVALPRT
jgi:spermidine synthase